MTQRIRPARWAARLFGDDLAAMLMETVPLAIQAAVGRQMDGHEAVGLSSRHAFGGSWPARYEELVNHLGEIPGVETVRPFGKSYRIVVVNNVAILPVEYAKDLATAYDSPKALKKINKTALELARQFGPEPTHTQPVIEGLGVESDTAGVTPELLRGLHPDGIVIVYYAAHERQGLLNIGWGQISVNDSATAQWVTAQTLLVPMASPIPGLRVLTRAGLPTTAKRFDHGDLKNPLLAPRTSAEITGTTTEQPVQRSHAQE
jgi:hypothetical protein